MITVQQILKRKKTLEICTIGPEASVFDAIRVMAEHNLGALIVTSGGALQGVITERDYARKIILCGRSSKTTTVREIMSEQVVYVTPETSIEECMALMLGEYIRHLPVIADGVMVSIVSMGDIVRAVLDERQFQIDQLVGYIVDSPMTVREKTWRGEMGVAIFR